MQRGFLAVAIVLAGCFSAFATPKCFDNVTITGYYVPVLGDYDAKNTTTINIGGENHTYNSAFIAEVMVKTGGISAKGENLVYWESEWRIQDEPLNPPSGWFPEEKDFLAQMSVTTAEGGTQGPFPKAFVAAVDLEGSGKVADGKYLGRPWDGRWHFRTKALDASEREVALGVVATDPKFFNKAHPLPVTIDPKPAGFENVLFEARDKGPAIVDRHIDVFAGYGLEGLARTLALTSDGNTVCFG